jgi:hypothetical protein
MKIINPLVLLGFTAIAAAAGSGPDRAKNQFRSWYPQYCFIFQNITTQDCNEYYQSYLYGTKDNITAQWSTGGDEHTLLIEPLINCILTNTSAYIQYQLQTAQIILGLTPTILAILGSS